MTLALSICFLLMAATGYWYSRSLFSPYTATALVWGLVILLYCFFGKDLVEISGRFIPCIILWVCMFFISSLVAEHCTPNRKSSCWTINYGIFYSLMALALISMAYITVGTIKFAITYPGDFFITLRIANNQTDQRIINAMPSFGMLPYLASSAIILLLACFSSKEKSKAVFSLLFISNFLFSALSMGKLSFFVIFISLVVINSYKHIIKGRTVAIIGIFFFIAILCIQIARDSFLNDSVTFKRMLNNYIISGMGAFDYADIVPNMSGENLFRFVHALTNALGITNYDVGGTILPFVTIGPQTETNVYTILFPFYTDYGMFGVGLGGVIYGLIYGFLYKKAANSDTYLILYSIFFAYIALQFFAELIFTNFSLNLQYIIYTVLVYMPIELKKAHDNG